MGAFAHEISGLTLQPSRGGVFEVTVDDDLVYSKKATGRHATTEELQEAMRSHLQAA